MFDGISSTICVISILDLVGSDRTIGIPPRQKLIELFQQFIPLPQGVLPGLILLTKFDEIFGEQPTVVEKIAHVCTNEVWFNQVLPLSQTIEKSLGIPCIPSAMFVKNQGTGNPYPLQTNVVVHRRIMEQSMSVLIEMLNQLRVSLRERKGALKRRGSRVIEKS